MKLKSFKWKISKEFRFNAWVFKIPEIDFSFYILNVSKDKDGNFLNWEGLNYEIFFKDQLEPIFYEKTLKAAKEKVQVYVEDYFEKFQLVINKLKIES